MHTVLLGITQLAGAIPPDISGTGPKAPPAASGFLWLLSILIWGAFLVCMAGMARAGGRLAWAGIKPASHGGGNAVSELAFSAVGLIVVGSLGVIATAVAAATG